MVLCAPPLIFFLTGTHCGWLEFGFAEDSRLNLKHFSQSISKLNPGHFKSMGLCILAKSLIMAESQKEIAPLMLCPVGLLLDFEPCTSGFSYRLRSSFHRSFRFSVRYGNSDKSSSRYSVRKAEPTPSVKMACDWSCRSRFVLPHKILISFSQSIFFSQGSLTDSK